MIRSTHSMRVRLCMPTRVSSRMRAGRPITWAKSLATLKYSPYSASRSLGYRCRAIPSPVTSTSSSSPAAILPVS
jgi:hypothetical protein